MGINAIDRLSRYENIQIVKIQGSLWFCVGDNLVFRFKKGNHAGYSRNYPTQNSLAFHDPQSSLIPDIQRIEIQYVLNVTETAIEDIIVVARNGKTIHWLFSILETEGNVVELPEPDASATQISTPVAKLKKGVIVDNEILIKD